MFCKSNSISVGPDFPQATPQATEFTVKSVDYRTTSLFRFFGKFCIFESQQSQTVELDKTERFQRVTQSVFFFFCQCIGLKCLGVCGLMPREGREGLILEKLGRLLFCFFNANVFQTRGEMEGSITQAGLRQGGRSGGTDLGNNHHSVPSMSCFEVPQTHRTKQRSTSSTSRSRG